jgi:hypothetical protein
MLRIPEIGLGALLAVALVAIGFTMQSAQPPQTAKAPSEQQFNSAIKRETNSNQQTSTPGQDAAAKHEKSAGNTKEKADKDTEKSAEEASEFWTILGRRLKITDTLLAAFTFVLIWVGIGHFSLSNGSGYA